MTREEEQFSRALKEFKAKEAYLGEVSRIAASPATTPISECDKREEEGEDD